MNGIQPPSQPWDHYRPGSVLSEEALFFGYRCLRPADLAARSPGAPRLVDMSEAERIASGDGEGAGHELGRDGMGGLTPRNEKPADKPGAPVLVDSEVRALSDLSRPEPRVVVR